MCFCIKEIQLTSYISFLTFKHFLNFSHAFNVQCFTMWLDHFRQSLCTSLANSTEPSVKLTYFTVGTAYKRLKKGAVPSVFPRKLQKSENSSLDITNDVPVVTCEVEEEDVCTGDVELQGDGEGWSHVISVSFQQVLCLYYLEFA